MFEEETENREYHLFISQIPDSTKEYDLFTEKLKNAYDFSFVNHSLKNKTNKSELEEQLSISEVVIILSGQYAMEPALIKGIVLEAKKQEKPIVLIRPYGLETVPLELEELSDGVVGWNAPCIIDAIKNVLGEGDDEASCEIL